MFVAFASPRFLEQKVGRGTAEQMTRLPDGRQRNGGGGVRRRLPRSYSDLLIQRTRCWSLALSSKPVIFGETTQFDT